MKRLTTANTEKGVPASMVWTLRRKILAGYGLLLVLIVGVIALAIVDLLHLGRAGEAILSENYKSILAAENMIDSIERQDSAVLLLLLGYEEEGVSQFSKNESQFLQWLSRARDNITIAGEQEIVNRIDTDYVVYLQHFSQLRWRRGDSPSQGTSFYHETVLPTFKAVRDACVSLREINSETMFNASEQAATIARKATFSMGAIGLLTILIGFGFSLLLSSVLVRPLKLMMHATQGLAEGSYDVQIKTSSSDELGRLALEFNTMARKLKAYHDLNIVEIVAEKRKNAAIIKSIDDGIIVVDPELRTININPAAARAFGVEAEKAQNRHLLEIVKDETLAGLVRQCIESGKQPEIQEERNILSIQEAEGQRHFQYAITPVHVGADAMSAVVLMLRDVTRLKELDRLKTEFVMAASHELRTPLTSMGMSIDLLLENTRSKLNDKEQQLLLVAHEEVERLKALVNNLLDLSKIEAGKMEMDFDRVSAAMLCQKAVAVMKPQADDKGVRLSLQCAEGASEVRADANKIVWVLINLISNALRYTDIDGFIQVAVERAGAQLHFTVRDNGMGIPYEFQPKVFDKFVQIKGDKTAGGSGLGLAISREIVRAHGGTIWVESTPGQGSTFTFTLPAAQAA